MPHVGMRRGVTVDEALEALTAKGGVGAIVVNKKNEKSGKRSQLFKGQHCKVAVNPDTGELIQANPKK